VKRLALALVVLAVIAAPAHATTRVKASGAEPVAVAEDGCWIHVHRAGYRLPQPELHVQCTVSTGGYLGSGAIITYRYPERGVPTSFGALVEEQGHGWVGDIPYMRAWQDPEHPRLGHVWVPGPHLERPNGTYVHVVWVVWNGALHDAIREVWPPPADVEVA
jgi:hypothetical protein